MMYHVVAASVQIAIAPPARETTRARDKVIAPPATHTPRPQMALEFTATLAVLAGQGGQGGLEGSGPGGGPALGVTGQPQGSGTSDDRANPRQPVEGPGHPTGQWSLVASGLARRDWVGRCVHCSRGLVVTVKTNPSGQDVCRVSPYDSHWDRPRSRSRSRSPTPVISPVRTDGDGVGRQTVSHTAGQVTQVDEDDALVDSVLPAGLDTRLLEFL